MTFARPTHPREPGTGAGHDTIQSYWSAAAVTRGEQPWLVFYPDGGNPPIRFTCLEFYRLCVNLASLLLSKGAGHGTRIATVGGNHSDTVLQYFASWLIGAVVVPINTGEDDRRIAFILEHSRARFAFVRDEFRGRIDSILSQNHERPEILRAGSDIPPADSAPVLPVSVPDDDALIVYTSGTTGNPKGVVLTQRNLLADAAAIAGWHGLSHGNRMMCVLPIHHVNGIVVTLLTPLVSGGSTVLCRKFHTGSFFPRIAQERIGIVSVVPTILQFLLHEQPDRSELDLSSLRHVICGAGPLTCDLAASFENRFGIRIIHGYGLSETTCYSCFLPTDEEPEVHRSWLTEYGFPSIGIPLPVNEMAIHDVFGNELGPDVRGEIVIRGGNVMRGYYDNPEANARAFAHGWFHSGDEGFYTTDGAGRKYFFITGRIKELIIRGGVNISPFEIDEVLMSIPGVWAGVSVGFTNDWYGEEVGAYIVLHDGVEMTEEEILERSRRTLPFGKSPKVVVFGREIPVTSTGKYQRSRVRPLFDRWKEIQFSPPGSVRK